MLVPRPASTSSFTVPHSLLSSPKRIKVPAPACPLKVAGPLCVPVNVMRRHGAASAAGTTVVIQRPATTATAMENRFMCLSLDQRSCSATQNDHLQMLAACEVPPTNGARQV